MGPGMRPLRNREDAMHSHWEVSRHEMRSVPQLRQKLFRPGSRTAEEETSQTLVRSHPLLPLLLASMGESSVLIRAVSLPSISLEGCCLVGSWKMLPNRFLATGNLQYYVHTSLHYSA